MPLSRTDFEMIFTEQRDVVFRFLMRLTRRAEMADDLVQETFLALWQARRSYRPQDDPLPYLRRVAFRRYLNMRRGNVRRQRRDGARARNSAAHELDVAVESSDARRSLRRRVDAAVNELPRAQREAFVLFRVCGLSCAEVAEVVGISPKAVESRVLRATRTLSARLATHRHAAAPE